MTISRKWHIGENGELTKTTREILTNGNYKKMANFGRTREIAAKMASMSKIRQEYRQIFNKVTKRVILTNGDFTKITNLARIYRINNL